MFSFLLPKHLAHCYMHFIENLVAMLLKQFPCSIKWHFFINCQVQCLQWIKWYLSSTIWAPSLNCITNCNFSHHQKTSLDKQLNSETHTRFGLIHTIHTFLKKIWYPFLFLLLLQYLVSLANVQLLQNEHLKSNMSSWKTKMSNTLNPGS